jgi:hypothetical protein
MMLMTGRSEAAAAATRRRRSSPAPRSRRGWNEREHSAGHASG